MGEMTKGELTAFYMSITRRASNISDKVGPETLLSLEQRIVTESCPACWGEKSQEGHDISFVQT